MNAEQVEKTKLLCFSLHFRKPIISYVALAPGKPEVRVEYTDGTYEIITEGKAEVAIWRAILDIVNTTGTKA